MFPVWIVPQLDTLLYFAAIAVSFVYTHISYKEHAYDVRLFVRKNLQAIKYREEQFAAIHCTRYEEPSDDSYQSRRSSSSSSSSEEEEEEEEIAIILNDEESNESDQERHIQEKEDDVFFELPRPVMIRAPKRMPNAVIRV